MLYGVGSTGDGGCRGVFWEKISVSTMTYCTYPFVEFTFIKVHDELYIVSEMFYVK